MDFFTRGKRGDIFLEKIKGQTIVVKKKREDSKALDTMKNEARWLKTLNKKRIGPKLLSFRQGSIRMEYVQGEPFVDFYDKHKNKTVVNTIIKELFRQCRVMDVLNVSKEEMHKPIKHILITSKHKPVMLDFERCRNTEKPQNVTQFCQFLLRLHVPVDKTALKDTLRSYKTDYSEKNYKTLLALFRL